MTTNKEFQIKFNSVAKPQNYKHRDSIPQQERFYEKLKSNYTDNFKYTGGVLTNS